jgi:hypothetical protein
MLPGHATLRNLSRYSSSNERTCSRWYASAFDLVSLKKAAILQVTPPEHEQALVLDASFIPKSGKKTSGLDRCWNGGHGRSEQGLEISALAWLDITANCADSLSVKQTPPTSEATDPETTRLDVYLDQLTHVVSAHDLSHLRDVITDGYDSKQKVISGVKASGRHQLGTLRIDANLRSLYQGPKRRGPGRPKTYDGKVHWNDLTRFIPVATEDDHMVLSHQRLNHVQFQCNLRVVLVIDTQDKRRAWLLSTDVALDALTIYRYDKARVQLEFLFRDAKQFTGLCDCQARAQATLDFHFKASLTAVTLATLEAHQENGDAMSSFSMARLKRRAFNQQLIDRICDHLAKGHRLEKSSPDDEELCNDGSITALAA